jgi:hypothetical protein
MTRNVVLTAFAMLVLAALGCADNHQQPTTRPLSADEKQAAVMKDPWGYGATGENVDITGGKISEFDKKAFKKDVDTVFSP